MFEVLKESILEPNLTLNKLRGGTKCPKHFRTLTILSMMKYGLSILHVNFFFGVKNHSKIKFWGYWKRNFEKFAFEIFFSLKIKAKNFEIIFFFKKFSYPIVLFDNKYEFRMILAFIWYAYCLCRCKIVIFHKLTCQKFENLGVKLSYFGITLQKKYGS